VGVFAAHRSVRDVPGDVLGEVLIRDDLEGLSGGDRHSCLTLLRLREGDDDARLVDVGLEPLGTFLCQDAACDQRLSRRLMDRIRRPVDEDLGRVIAGRDDDADRRGRADAEAGQEEAAGEQGARRDQSEDRDDPHFSPFRATGIRPRHPYAFHFMAPMVPPRRRRASQAVRAAWTHPRAPDSMMRRAGKERTMPIRFLGCATAALAIAAAGGEARVDGKDVRIAEDGTLVVDGKRVFAIGSYWNPPDDVALRRLRDGGFNFIRCPAETDALERVRRAGFLAWVPLGRALEVAEGDARDAERLQAALRAAGDHPAVAVWEAPDEALWNVWYGRQLAFAAARREVGERIGEIEDAARRSALAARLEEADRAAARADLGRAEASVDALREEIGLRPLRAEERVTLAPKAALESLDRLVRGIDLLRDLDPAKRPVWMNHAPRNTIEDLHAFSRPFDIVGCDIYPAPEEPAPGHCDLANRSLSCVGDHTERMKEVAPARAVWMVLQGFGWRDLQTEKSEDPRAGRRPTEAELRFMAWDAIAHGARGILFWGMEYSREPGDFHDALLRVVREIAGAQEFLAAPDEPFDLTAGPTWSSLDRRPIGILRRSDGGRLLAVVNECRDPMTVIASRLGVPDGTPVRIRGRVAGQVRGGGLSIPLEGHGVEIMRLETHAGAEAIEGEGEEER